jgi:hypothetical protein
MAEDVGWWVFMAATLVYGAFYLEQVARKGVRTASSNERDTGGERKSWARV